MKRRQKATHFLAGVLTAFLVMSLTVPAMAAVSGKNITIYPGISIYLDDNKLTPKDANGKEVEVFVYNGTTYLPVRAISEALDIPVEWDASTRTVYLGDHAGSVNYLLTVCPPYQTERCDFPTTVSMAGKKYANCMTIGKGYPGYAIFNLDGKYDTLTFTLGHIDGADMREGQSYNFYLDGELVSSIDLDPEALPKEYKINLNGALQLKIESNKWCYAFALADMKVS